MKTLILFCFLTIISVDIPLTDDIPFSGFGTLIIGKEFQSLEIAKNLKRSPDKSWYNKNIKISEDIGYVTDLHVWLYEGKIYKVDFTGEDYTKHDAIEFMLSQLIETHATRINQSPFRYYFTADKKIGFTTFVNPDRTVKYSYFDHSINIQQIRAAKK